MSSQPPPQGPPSPPAGPPPDPPPGPPGPAPTGGGPSKGVIAAIVLGFLIVVGGGVTAAVLLLSDEERADCAVGASMAGCVEPTEEPTDEPTAEPTQEPTDEPTDEPTAAPTNENTEEPVDGDPADAVQGFIDAVLADDCQTAITYLSERLIRAEDASCDDFDSSAMAGMEYGTPRVVEADGSSATVEQPVDVAAAGQTVTLEFEMVYKDDRWVIDDFDATRPSSTPTP